MLIHHSVLTIYNQFAALQSCLKCKLAADHLLLRGKRAAAAQHSRTSHCARLTAAPTSQYTIPVANCSVQHSPQPPPSLFCFSFFILFWGEEKKETTCSKSCSNLRSGNGLVGNGVRVSCRWWLQQAAHYTLNDSIVTSLGRKRATGVTEAKGSVMCLEILLFCFGGGVRCLFAPFFVWGSPPCEWLLSEVLFSLSSLNSNKAIVLVLIFLS